jgi:hypothetical protein
MKNQEIKITIKIRIKTQKGRNVLVARAPLG